MVYPNADIGAFCYWMLNISWQTLSPPRVNLITDIYNAAINNTSVTDTDYNNFIQVSAWRYEYYLIWLNGQQGGAALSAGTPNFWFRMQDLVNNTANAAGTTAINNQVSLVNDYAGGAVTATAASIGARPFLMNLKAGGNLVNYLAFNTTNAHLLNINNGLALTNNVPGYTVYMVGRCVSNALNKIFFYISTAGASTVVRFYLATDTNNNLLVSYRRLDGDAQQFVTGPSMLTQNSIIAVALDFQNLYLKIFVNGVLYSNTAVAGPAANTSATNSLYMSIGGYSAGLYLLGYLADVIFFNSVQSDANIVANMNALNTLHKCY